jgi:hypothetical protein
MTRVRLLIAVSVLVAACGGGGDDDQQDAAGNPDVAGAPDAPGASTLPEPGTEDGGEWTDVEPNDTPGDATPVGVVNGPIWAGFVEPYTTIDSPTDVDFYVFRAPGAAELGNVNMQFCWGGGLDLLDLYLYEVMSMTQGALIQTANTTNTSCETIIPFGEGANILTADAVYLLEVRAAPTVPAGTPATMYGA